MYRQVQNNDKIFKYRASGTKSRFLGENLYVTVCKSELRKA